MRRTFLPSERHSAFERYLAMITLSLALLLGVSMQSLQAQIPVTVSGTATTSPALLATYPDLATALGDLNLVTSYSTPGTIIFTCTAGSSETAPPTGFEIGSATLNPLLSAINTVTINKSGGTVTINAGVGTATPTSAAPDGMISIKGADYITIDGLTLTDGNLTNPATMEFGIGLFKASLSDGAQNNTITNCTINMQRINNATSTAPMIEGAVGILVVNRTATATASLTPTTAAGTNSNNKFYTNTINGGNYGIGLSGFAAASPFTAGDTGNDVGGSSLATGNSILNYGGGATTNPAAGIRANNQWSVNISYNTVNNNNGSGVNHATTLRGIFAQAGTSANATINNNTITLQSGATTSACTAIDNGIGSTAASNTININNNTVNVNYSTATSGIYTGINNSATAATVNINGNTITAASGGVLAGTGTHVMIETGTPTNANANNNTIQNINRDGASGSWRGIKTTSPTNLIVNGNTIENLSWTNLTSTGSIDGFYSLSSAVNVTVTNNIVRNLSVPTTGTINGIREFGVTGTKTIQNNQVYSFSTTAGGAGGATMNGIFCSTGNIGMSNNQIYSLNSTGTTGGTGGTVYGIQISGGTTHTIFKNSVCDLSSTSTNPIVAGITIAGGTTNTISNNRIGDLRAIAANAANPLIGINITSGTTVNVYCNTVNISGTSSGALFGSSAISAATGTTLTLNNNIFVNNSTANGAGVTAAYRRSSTTLTSYVATSDRNDFFAPTLFFDGTNNITTLPAYKTFMVTRDANSVNTLPPFLSTACGNGNFLKINTAIATAIESGGANVGSITDDFENDIRFGNGGYAGTGTAPDIGADEFNGTPLPICAGIPTASTITGVAAVCLGTGTTLSLSNPYNEVGITYQWASSTTSGGSYTNLGTGATQATGNLTVPTYYIVTVTCAFGSSFVTAEKSVLINALPTIGVNPPTGSICSPGGAAITLTANGGVTYAWSPTLGLTPTTGAIVSANPSATTTYTVTGTDSNGCTGTASSVITVAAKPVLTVTATPATICFGANSNLLAVAGTSNTSTYTVAATTYGLTTPVSPTTVALTDDDATGAIPLPFSFSFFGTFYSSIYIHSNGFASFSSGQPLGSPYLETIPTAATPNNYIAICHDDLNVTGGAVVSYFTTGTTPNRIFVINWSAVKFYNTAANNGNMSGQIKMFEIDNHIEVHVTSNDDPVPNAHTLGIENSAGSAGFSPPGRNNVNYNFTSATPEAWSFQPSGTPSGGTFSYSWSPPTFLSATNIANPIATAVSTTTTYTVTATETSGCTSTGSVTVTTSAPISSATITPATPAFCTGGSVTLTATPDNGGGPFTYTWADPSNNPAGTAATQVANVGGTWTVTVSDNCGGSVVVTKTVTQNAIPTATAGSNSPVCVGSPLNLSVTTDIGTTYLWAGPNTFSSTLQSPSIASATLAAAGTYTVTVTSIGGCTATSSTIVSVVASPVITSTTATPNSICPGENSQLQVNLQAPSAYCTSIAFTSNVEAISLVQFAGIDNASACAVGAGAGGALQDFTAISGNVVAGSIYPMTLSGTTDGSFTNFFTAFFDWDQNGVFETSVPIGSIANTACVLQATNNVTVPPTALNGSTRMRIVKNFNSSPTDPCGSYGYGQAEDYTIIVTGGLAAATYSWSPALFLNNADIANPLASAVTSTTTYNVTVTNGAGCTATGTTTVTVNPTVSAGTILGTSPLCVNSTSTYTTDGTAGGTWSSSDDLVATVDSGSGLVTAIGAGNATITYTVNTGCGSPVSSVFAVNVVANTSNTTTVSVCDTYTWSANGTTYTSSGTYTSVTGCHTEILDLTITPSTSNTTTVSVCDTYTWAVNGTTYTLSGIYTSVTGCHTEILDLTITPSTSNTTTISACDTYTWPVNGTTYTGSDTYTFVSGCHTEILNLTIITSTSNTTTQSACDTYTWAENGTTYTSSGTYSSITGCHTEILNLTITASTSNTTTVTDCFQYFWDVTGQFYYASGVYTNTVGCHSEILDLTINQCTFNFTFAFTDPCSCNNNATLVANDGTFTEVAGVTFVSQNGSVPEDFVVTILSSTGTTGLVNGSEIFFNEADAWETGLFTHVDNLGYTIVFEVRAAVENNLGLDGGTLVATVTGTNKCAYPNPAVSGLASSYCTSGSGGVPDTDITAILTGSPTGPTGTFTLSGTDLSGGPGTYTFTPPAGIGTSTVSGSYTGGSDANNGVSPDGGTTPAFPGCIQPFSATTNIVDCPPGCNASPNMQWDN